MNGLRSAICALALSAPGCTWGEGSGFATLESTHVSAQLQLDERTPDELTTDLGYVVQLESAELFVEDVVLEQGGQTEHGAQFDPAHPPDGYSSCHAGHCHSDDGRLVPYAEIEAERAASGEEYTAVVSVPVHAPLDLLRGGPLRVRHAQPSAELPRAELERVTLHAESLRIRGSVRDATGVSLPLHVDLALHASLRAAVHVDIDRDTAARVRATVELAVPASLLDGVDFARFADAGSVTLSEPTSPAAEPVLDALDESELRFELR